MHWRAHNPWKDEAVYVPLVELAHCCAGGLLMDRGTVKDYTYEDVLKHWRQCGRTKLDGYILPSLRGDHSIGVRWGKNPEDYYSPANKNPELTDDLLARYQGWSGNPGIPASPARRYSPSLIRPIPPIQRRNYNGPNRQSSTATYGSAAFRAGASARGSSAELAKSFAQLQAYFYPDPEPIPHAGIRAGELTGYRMWWLIEGKLCSLAHKHLWEPLATQHGNVNERVKDKLPGLWVPMTHIMGGVYAWHSPVDRDKELKGYLESVAYYQKEREAYGATFLPTSVMGGWVPYEETGTLVTGTIKMWGEVVEHEKGYRAQYAKVASVDAIGGENDYRATLAGLRALYNVECA